tara:strand:- start:365 stop:667 length:303 start_codon:yes stop_codon:yes gene_type:complete
MINVDSVLKSYTGKVGCMCGCNGTYKVASKHLDAAGVERGYAYGDDEVSDRSVKMAVNKLNKLIDWDDEEAVDKHVEEWGAWFETASGRNTVVYFIPRII